MAKAGFQTAILVLGIATICSLSIAPSVSAARPDGEELMVTSSPLGHLGGRLVLALRSEPKTLNPVLAQDAASEEVIRCVTADLIDINRKTQKTEPALAKSWAVSRDGKQYTLHLREGIRFSDGQLLTADDVVFSFQLYLDEKIDSPQRDLLIVGGKADRGRENRWRHRPIYIGPAICGRRPPLRWLRDSSTASSGERLPQRRFLARVEYVDAAEPVCGPRPISC